MDDDRQGRAWRRLRAAAVAALVTNIGIVVTGGAVRLTASGLGCPTFPRCTGDSLVPTGELGVHGAIEFGNRLLTFVLVAVAVLVVVRAWRIRPARRDLRALSAGLLAGIPAQALIGGVTVLTGLNPWVVMLHFVCSMVLVALATVLLRRVDEPAGPIRVVVTRPVRVLAGAVVSVAGLAAYVGTVVTGSGPHAGDRSAARTGLDVLVVTQLHADLAFALVGLTVGLVVVTRAVGAPRRLVRAADVLLVVEAAQALIGYTQYFTGLPPLLVGAHMLGASLLVAAAVDTWLATRVRVAEPRGDLGPVPVTSRQVPTGRTPTV
jgi:cytochrome c oxidase assembly protein subunit 15